MLEKAIGFIPRQETMLWVKERACELARPGAVLLNTEIGDEISQGVVCVGCRRAERL